MTNEAIKIEGWTNAGGMWGDAAWKQLAPNLVLALGQAPDDYLSAPYDWDEETAVTVYRGEPYEGWALEEGEGPTDVGDTFMFPNLTTALLFADVLAEIAQGAP